MKMALSVAFSLWKLQYVPWEVYLPYGIWVTVQIGRSRKQVVMKRITPDM